MAQLQTIQLSHLPSSLAIHVALYNELKNASFLREQLLAGNTEFEYAFIDASRILSTKHALAAAFRAINDYANNRLKSKNVHSEIVFSLSPTSNIADSFRKFGVTEATKHLLVIKVSTSPEITHDSVAQHLDGAIEGTPIPFSDESLRAVLDLDGLLGAYKLGAVIANRKLDGISEEDRQRLEKCIIGSIGLRGAT